VDAIAAVKHALRLEFDATCCSYAEFFRELDEPELGALLMCSTDFDIAATSEGEVTLEREQTIMQGAPSCTFRYRFAPRRLIAGSALVICRRRLRHLLLRRHRSRCRQRWHDGRCGSTRLRRWPQPGAGPGVQPSSTSNR
jgi:hypothetical protein